MAPAARYNDGAVATNHPVRLSIGDGSGELSIRADDGRELDRWRLTDIRLTEPASAGDAARFRLEGRDAARLIAAGDARYLIENACGRLLTRRSGRDAKSIRIAAWGVAALAGVLMAILFLVPRFAHEAAQLMPAALDRRIGQATQTAVIRLIGSGGACEAPDGRKVLDRLSERLAKAAGLERTPTVTVIDVPVLNAVALPGGQVLVFSRLLREAPDGNALAGVLGHEFGHVLHRDPTEMMIRQSTLSLLVGVLAGDVYGGTFIGSVALMTTTAAYSRGVEAAADDVAIQILARARIDAKSFGRFFELIGSEQGSASARIPSFLMTHPDPGDREAKILSEGQPGGDAMSDTDWHMLQRICGDDAKAR